MNDKNQPAKHGNGFKKTPVDEQFEQKAGVKIHNKDTYGGGSGFYSNTQNSKSPNVNNEKQEDSTNKK